MMSGKYDYETDENQFGTNGETFLEVMGQNCNKKVMGPKVHFGLFKLVDSLQEGFMFCILKKL